MKKPSNIKQNNAGSILILLTPGFPENEADSTCLPSQQILIKAFNRRYPNLQVIILSFQYPFTDMAYQWNNNTVIPFNGQGKSKLYRRILWARVWRKIKSISAQKNVIGIFSFWLDECAFIGNRFQKKYQLPHYCWILGQDARKGNKYVKHIDKSGVTLVALSDFIQAEFERNYLIRPQQVIPIGVEPVQMENSQSRYIDIMGAGSLIPLKQYELFIAVIGALKQTFPNIQSTLCGKGPEKAKLTMLADRFSLQQNIAITGEKSHPDIVTFMQHAKIFLHTSSYEGFGTVCIEALAAGAHVVSFCKPMDQSIEHWHIVKGIKEMITRIRQLLSDPNLDHTPVVPFLIDDTAKAILQLYHYSDTAT